MDEKLHWSVDSSHRKARGCEFVCEVPKDLRSVTGLTVRRGKVVAHTESGIDLIVPMPSK